MEIEIVQLLVLDFQKKSEKEQFMSAQSAQCSKASVAFEETLRNVIREVQSVINITNNLFGVSTNDQQNGASHRGGGFGDMPEKAKSLVQLKQEKIERKLMRQRAKLEYSTLPDFIRYVDYLCVETLVGLTVRSIDTFYDELVKSR